MSVARNIFLPSQLSGAAPEGTIPGPLGNCKAPLNRTPPMTMKIARPGTFQLRDIRSDEGLEPLAPPKPIHKPTPVLHAKPTGKTERTKEAEETEREIAIRMALEDRGRKLQKWRETRRKMGATQS